VIFLRRARESDQQGMSFDRGRRGRGKDKRDGFGDPQFEGYSEFGGGFGGPRGGGDRGGFGGGFNDPLFVAFIFVFFI